MMKGRGAVDLLFKFTAMAIGVALCAGLGQLFNWLYAQAPYLAFLPVIVGSCALGGLSLAAWATFISAAATWYIFVASDDFATVQGVELAHLCAFVAMALFVCWVIEIFRRSNETLSRDNIYLGIKISSLMEQIRRW